MKSLASPLFLVVLFCISCSSHKHVANCPHFDNYPLKRLISGNYPLQKTGRIDNPLDQDQLPVLASLNALESKNTLSLQSKRILNSYQDHFKKVASNKNVQTLSLKIPSESTNRKDVKKAAFKKNLGKESKELKSHQETKGNPRGLAIASLVTGLVSLFVAGIPLGILAIVFGAVSMGKLEKGNGRGMAVAGLILGIVGVLGALIFLAVAV